MCLGKVFLTVREGSLCELFLPTRLLASGNRCLVKNANWIPLHFVRGAQSYGGVTAKKDRHPVGCLSLKNKISLLLIIVIILSTFAILSSCTPEKNSYMTPPTINGVSLKDYTIVYDQQGLDYNKRAAEYIKNTSKERYGVDLAIVDDAAAQSSHEIVVGETSRSISASLDAETVGVEFSILLCYNTHTIVAGFVYR